MRRTVLPLTAVLAFAPLGLAHAEPVSQNRLAQIAFTLSDGKSASQRIRLTVTDATRPRLTLQVSDCDAAGCADPQYYEARLDPTQVKIAQSTATAELSTTVAGIPLQISWTPDNRTAVKGGTEGGSGEGGETLSAYRAEPALAKITYATVPCSDLGAVGDELRIETPDQATGPARPLTSFVPAPNLRCQPDQPT